MGQQQTVAGSALRRMILVLAVAALMAAMMAVSAMPAFAAGQGTGLCVKNNIAKSGDKQDTPSYLKKFCGV